MRTVLCNTHRCRQMRDTHIVAGFQLKAKSCFCKKQKCDERDVIRVYTVSGREYCFQNEITQKSCVLLCYHVFIVVFVLVSCISLLFWQNKPVSV